MIFSGTAIAGQMVVREYKFRSANSYVLKIDSSLCNELALSISNAKYQYSYPVEPGWRSLHFKTIEYLCIEGSKVISSGIIYQIPYFGTIMCLENTVYDFKIKEECITYKSVPVNISGALNTFVEENQ